MKTRHFVVLVLITLLATTFPTPAAEKWASTEERAFRSEFDGSEQRYVIMLPDEFDAQREHHLLIVLHGHGSDRWQYVRQARGECAGARDVALKHGMIFLSPDYRAPDSWMGPAAEADLVQIIRHMRRMHRIGKVVLGGGSMGGTGALIFAALHPELVDGVVSQNGTANLLQYARFQDSIARSYGGSKAEKPDEYRKRSPELVPERFKMPVAVTTGGKDTLVPPDSVLRLADSLKKSNPDVMVIHRENGGHATNYEDTVAAYEFVIGRVVAAEPGGRKSRRSVRRGSPTPPQRRTAGLPCLSCENLKLERDLPCKRHASPLFLCWWLLPASCPRQRWSETAVRPLWSLCLRNRTNTSRWLPRS